MFMPKKPKHSAKSASCLVTIAYTIQHMLEIAKTTQHLLFFWAARIAPTIANVNPIQSSIIIFKYYSK